jgi:hypothetical protein
MSHVTQIAIEVTDLDALEQACRTLGLELRRGQTTYKWYGTYVGDSPMPEGMSESMLGHCHHAIRLPGWSHAYEIGVVQVANNTYRLHIDEWQGGYGMVALAGTNCAKLLQRYGLNVAAAQAKKEGMRVIGESLQQDGSIRLVLEPKQQFAFAGKGF